MSQHTNQSHFPQGPQYGQTSQPPPQHHGHGAPQQARNGLGTAALVLGIIGALSGVIPLFFWLAGVLGLIALILGLSGRGRAKRGGATNKGVALTGAVLGLVALILSVVGAVITFKAVDTAVKEVDKALSGQEATDTTGDKSGGKDDKGGDGGTKTAKALAPGATAEYAGKLKVTVSAAAKHSPSEYAVGHTKGNKAYKVTVTIENTGTEKFDSALSQVDARAGTDGKAAEQIYDGDTTGAGFTGSILPGKKATAVYAFDAPAAAKNLTIEVTPGFLDFKSSHWDLKL